MGILPLAVALGLLAGQSEESRVEHVVIVSIDGLRPEFYLEGGDAPALRAMAVEGVHARAVEGVFPSVTYAGHASIVTGVRPWKHGIHANTRWGKNGPERDWHWYASDIKARTLWDAAREAGRTTAVTYWPSTAGAMVDWKVPEIWDPEGKESFRRLGMAATPGLLAELALSIGIPRAGVEGDRSEVDRFIAEAAGVVFRRRKPGLLLAHLLQVDEEQHAHGRNAEEVRQAVRRVDHLVARLREAIGRSEVAARTLLIVVGDHGFRDATCWVHPNRVLADAGLIEVREGNVVSWRAMAHALGGAASVYVRDPAHVAEVREALRRGARQGGRDLYRVLERDLLDSLGFNPGAALALEAGEGVAFSGGLSERVVAEGGKVRGTHGQLPNRPDLLTGFVAVGAGIRKGTAVERIRLIDIAPTVARLLGLSMPDVEGRVLEEILE